MREQWAKDNPKKYSEFKALLNEILGVKYTPDDLFEIHGE